MILKEIFPTDAGICATVFNTDYPAEYARIFGDTLPKSLDIYAYMTYGNRTVLDCITADTAKDFVSSVIALNLSNWKKQAELLALEYDVIDQTVRKTVRNEERNSNGNDTNEVTHSNKAFNENEYTGTEKQNGTGTETRTETGTVTETVSGVGNGHTNSEVIQKEIELRLVNFKRKVIFAIVNEITTAVYNGTE